MAERELVVTSDKNGITGWNEKAWKEYYLTPSGPFGMEVARKLEIAYDLLEKSTTAQKSMTGIRNHIYHLMEGADDGKPAVLDATKITDKFLPNLDPNQFGNGFLSATLPGFLHEWVYVCILHDCQAPEEVRSQIRILLGAENADIPSQVQVFDGVKLMWKTTPVLTQNTGDLKPHLSDLLITVAPRETSSRQEALRTHLKTQQMRVPLHTPELLNDLRNNSLTSKILEGNMNRIYFGVGAPVTLAEIKFIDTSTKPANSGEVVKKITKALGASKGRSQEVQPGSYTRVRDRQKIRDLKNKYGFSFELPAVGGNDKVAVYRPKKEKNPRLVLVATYNEDQCLIQAYPSRVQIDQDKFLLFDTHIKRELENMTKDEAVKKGIDHVDPDKISTNFILRFTRKFSIRGLVLDTVAEAIKVSSNLNVSGVQAIRMLAYEVAGNLRS